MTWSQTLLSAGALLLAYSFATAVRRIYFSPLSRFPGPKLPAVTLWYEFYWDCVKQGQMTWRIQEMHEKYGPIVRVSPHEVHIMDSQFYDELYASGKKLDKYSWWVKAAGADGSSFATVPHDLHRLRRSALNPFFSVRSVTQVESLLTSKINKLKARFDAIAASKEVVRLDVAFIALTMDIICEYAFASDRKYLDEPDFKLLWKETILGAFKSGAIAKQMPWALPIMKALPLSFVFAVNPALAYMFEWSAGAKAEVARILEGTDSLSEKGITPRTIFHTLRDSNLPPAERSLQRLCDEAEIITGAGSETTAQTLARLFFYLCYEPQTLETLRKELDEITPKTGETPTWAELQRLPYLSAVIKEGLRISYGLTSRLPRISHEDIHYKGYVIPAGTPVSETPYFVMTDPSIFPEPAKFRPERWIEAEKKGERLDKYLVSFGRGTRHCLGINLAYAEMYLTVYSLVTRYDWEMYQTGLNDVVVKHDFMIPGADLLSKGVRATLSMRKQNV